MPRRIVVIGCGPAAVAAAIEARRTDAMAEVTLVADEHGEPYEKPPLSKGVLLGTTTARDAPIAGPAGLASHGVTIHAGWRAQSIDARNRTLATSGGALPYDALVIATGSVMRTLPALPPDMARVHYLRSEAHADALRRDLAGCKRLAVFGAGLIGLEVAATATQLGIAVTVLEVAPRILARVCDEETGNLILAEHHHHGVDIRTGVSLTQATPQPDGDLALETSDGEMVVAEVVVVGVGVKPDDAIAATAGLPTGDGIIVDAGCRTADPAIFAAGDVTRFPGPTGLVRQENWRHAQEHGAVAGRNAAGGEATYRSVPSFWSEQYDLYLQGVGWPSQAPDARVRRKLDGKAALMLETKDGVLSYALGINAQRDIAAIRRLIDRRIPVDPTALADPAQSFQTMLKAKA